MFKMEMQWKNFNVDLRAIDADLRAAHPSYVGNQAHRVLEFWFNADLSADDQAAVQAYWDGIASDSAEATGYQTAEQIKAAADADLAAKRASAAAKLEALGLTADEIAALRG